MCLNHGLGKGFNFYSAILISELSENTFDFFIVKYPIHYHLQPKEFYIIRKFGSMALTIASFLAFIFA